MIVISFMLQTRAFRNVGKWSVYGAKKDFTICNVNWFLVGILLHIFSLFFRLTNAEVLNQGIRKQHNQREKWRGVAYVWICCDVRKMYVESACRLSLRGLEHKKQDKCPSYITATWQLYFVIIILPILWLFCLEDQVY